MFDEHLNNSAAVMLEDEICKVVLNKIEGLLDNMLFVNVLAFGLLCFLNDELVVVYHQLLFQLTCLASFSSYL